jgi:hypothetical protein
MRNPRAHSTLLIDVLSNISSYAERKLVRESERNRINECNNKMGHLKIGKRCDVWHAVGLKYNIMQVGQTYLVIYT